VEEAYCVSATTTTGSEIYDNYKYLKNRIVFVQTQGTTLIVPSSCAHATFKLQSSILVSREVYLVGKFPQRLENEKLQAARTLTERHKVLRENDV
jgi:hypothetical protein